VTSIITRKPARLALRLLPALLAGALMAGCSDSPTDLVGSAKTFVEKGDRNAAMIQLKNALQANPDLAEARYLLGEIYFDRGEMANALKELERAHQLGYDQDGIYPMLARAMLREGRGAEVVKDYDTKTLQDKAADAALKTAVGDAYLATDVDVAEKKYREALAEDPNNLLAELGIARLRVSQRRFDEALSLLDGLLKKAPDMVDPYLLKGIVLVATQDLEGALAMYRKATEVSPSSQGAHIRLVSFLIQSKRIDEAKDALEKMDKAVGKTPMRNYLSALIAFRENEPTKARDLLQQVIKVAPDYLPGRLLAGVVFYRLNDQLQAQANLNKVLEAAPKNVIARQLLISSYIALRDSGRALDVLEPLLEEQPVSPETLNLAGQAYLLAGDFERSSKYFSMQVEKAPSDARAMTRLGISRLAAGDLDQGLDDLATASHLDEKFGYADVARVTALLSAHRYEDALKAQADLEKKVPNNPLVFNLRGGVLLAMHKRDEAAEAFREALKLNVNFLPAGKNLARILVAEGKVDEAREIFKRMLVDDPKHADVLMAQIELETAVGGDDATIRQLYETTIDANPDLVAARVGYAGYLASKKEPKKALAMIRDAQSIAPNHPAVLRMLSKVLLANGEREQAIAAMQKRADLSPKSGTAWLELGVTQLGGGDIGAAEASLKRAISVDPKEANAYIALFPILMKTQRFDEATRFAKALQKERPDASAGYLAEADVLAATKQWGDALRLTRKAHETWPSTVTVSVLHRMLLSNSQVAEARKLIADWLKTNPGDLVAMAKAAENFMSVKQYKDAEDIYLQLIEKAPNNAFALNNLAWLVHLRKDPKAMDYAQRALKIAPDNASILDTLGVIELDGGQVKAAVERLERAVELAPNVADIKINLANAYLQAGRKDDAKAIVDALSGSIVKTSPAGERLAELAKKL